MRTTQLVITYISAILFTYLAVRSLLAWTRNREPRSAYLALATALFAASQLISAIDGTLYNSLKNEQPPHALQAISSTLTFLALFAFILFLFTFLPAPDWMRWLLAHANGAFIGLAWLETTHTKITATRYIFTASPLPFRTYLWIVVAWLLFVSGILWILFIVNGFRAAGLARFRLLSIGAGFFLLFVVVGLIPLILVATTTKQHVQTLINVLEYMILPIAPLLLIGFTPPRVITRRFAPVR